MALVSLRAARRLARQTLVMTFSEAGRVTECLPQIASVASVATVRRYRCHIIASKGRFFRAGDPIPDDVKVAGCAEKYRIVDEQQPDAAEHLKKLPVDFSGNIFKTYHGDGGELEISAYSAIRDWVEHDLSYFDYGEKKLVLFVSLGGTCRCVLGKAILADLADRNKIAGLAVDAAAIADPHHATINPSALKAIRETGTRTMDRKTPAPQTVPVSAAPRRLQRRL